MRSTATWPGGRSSTCTGFPARGSQAACSTVPRAPPAFACSRQNGRGSVCLRRGRGERGSRGVGRDLAPLFEPWPFHPAAVAVPVLFFHGTDDRTVSLAATSSLAERMPGARLEVAEGHGHFSLLAREGESVLRAVAAARRRS